MKMGFSIIQSILLIFSILALLGCISSPVLYPSKTVTQDFFTCVGLEKGQWVDIKNEFTPEDNILAVVAQPDKSYLKTRITFELTSPNGRIALKEQKYYTRARDFGFYFDIERLIESGDYGQWRATFYSDGFPIGFTDFSIVAPLEEVELAGEISPATPFTTPSDIIILGAPILTEIPAEEVLTPVESTQEVILESTPEEPLELLEQ